jgi:UDP-N-acetylmuramoylalanine--D-glutamate ligase
MVEELRQALSISLLGGSFTTGKLIPLLEKEKIAYHGPFDSMGAALEVSLDSALKKERELPDLQQVILLSPGSASFELFDNEFDRGDQFRTLVNLLILAEESASDDTGIAQDT